MRRGSRFGFTISRRHVCRLGAMVGLLLACGAPAQAARFIPVEDECNGRQLLIQGSIEPGDYQRFLDFMARHVAGDQSTVQDPDVLWTVELDAGGGDLDEAMRIGRFLRAAYATTEVGYRYARRPDGVWDFARSGELVCLDGRDRLSGCHQEIVEAECTGACLLIWLAGATRHANEGRLGLHGLTDATPKAGAISRSRPTPNLTAYLADMNVPAPWITRILEGDVSVDETGWLSWPQRHELAGVAPVMNALIADCPPPLSREESYQSIAAPSPARQDALMDRADSHRSCRRDRLAEARRDPVAQLDRRARDQALAAAGSD